MKLSQTLEKEWFRDGSSFLREGKRLAGYSVTSQTQVIDARSLDLGTPAQKAELIALTQVLELRKGKILNVSDQRDISWRRLAD